MEFFSTGSGWPFDAAAEESVFGSSSSLSSPDSPGVAADDVVNNLGLITGVREAGVPNESTESLDDPRGLFLPIDRTAGLPLLLLVSWGGEGVLLASLAGAD